MEVIYSEIVLKKRQNLKIFGDYENMYPVKTVIE